MSDPTRLLERESELRAIGVALAAARRGSGSLLVVEGPAGIGKTRLLDAARRGAGERGALVLGARGAELEQELPFGLALQALAPQLDAVTAEERAELLSGHAAPAAKLFDGLPAAPAPGTPADPLPEMLHALHWLCARLAAQRPLLLALDDVHWSDTASLRWLHYLAGRLEAHRVLAIATLRPRAPTVNAELAQVLSRVAGAVRIAPAPLTRAAVAAAVRRRVDATVGDDACTACHEVTGGNPFLLSELLAELPGDAPLTGDAVVAASAGDVSRWALDRVKRLPPPAEALTRALAVLGDGARLATAAELAEVDIDAAREAAAALVACDVLAAGRRLRFAHPLVRASIAADLGGGEAGRLHGRAARLVHERGAEAGVVALHLDAAEPAGEQWAVAVLRQAARAALATGAAEVAVTHLRRALAEPPSPELRPVLLLELGRAAAAQLAPGAEDHLMAALDAAATDADRAAVAFELGRALVVRERPAEALAALDRGALAAAAAGDGELQLRIEAEALTATIVSPERARIAPPRADALIARAAAGETLGQRLALGGVAWERAVSVSARADDVVPIAERALAGGATLAVEGADSPSIYGAAAALAISDRYELAERHLDAAIDDARRRHSIGALAIAACWRSWTAYRAGALARAEEDAALSVRLASRSGVGLGSAVSLSVLVECLVARGAVGEGWEALDRWQDEEEMAHTTLYGPVLASRGRLHALSGDLAAAAADLRACGERHEAYGLRNPGAAAWRSGLARLELVGGDRDEALRLAGEELEIARAFGAPRNLGIALRGAAAVAESGARRVELLDEAIAVLEPSEAQLEHARALHALGAELVQADRAAAARPLLRAALDGATRCGAIALADTVRPLLVAAGGRPRRALLTGVGALTPSELRISQLAAEGLSNREIAEAEFLALRTVEVHLTRSYRKLGIRSRRELSTAL